MFRKVIYQPLAGPYADVPTERWVFDPSLAIVPVGLGGLVGFGTKNLLYAVLAGGVGVGGVSLLTPPIVEESLFFDDFQSYPELSDGSPYWNVLSGNWRVINNSYQQEEYFSAVTLAQHGLDWTDYDVDVTVRDLRNLIPTMLNPRFSILFRNQSLTDMNNTYNLRVTHEMQRAVTRYYIYKHVTGVEEELLAHAEIPDPVGIPINKNLKVRVLGNWITAYLNGNPIFRYAIEDSAFPRGGVGIWAFYSGVSIENIKVSLPREEL